MENSPLVTAKRTGVAKPFSDYNGSERRQETPSVNESSSFAAPQAFATRPAHAVGNRVRISINCSWQGNTRTFRNSQWKTRTRRTTSRHADASSLEQGRTWKNLERFVLFEDCHAIISG